jgi:negative regulator of flagellin synthesis FlgM
VKSLVSQALSTPEVRQEKVNALRQSISSGEYKLDPGKIAGAIISEGGQ